MFYFRYVDIVFFGWSEIQVWEHHIDPECYCFCYLFRYEDAAVVMCSCWYIYSTYVVMSAADLCARSTCV
jgi:hypothetical protein